jgi:nucleolar GTP-binding protein
VYIFDVSETCGYSVNQQERLLQEIREMKIPLIVVNNKCDLGESVYTNISTETHKGIDNLREEIEQHFSVHAKKTAVTE